MSKFIPRTTFSYPSHSPTWFAGHMSRSLRLLPALLHSEIDLVIEARDARVPLSGVNGVLEGVVRRSWGRVGEGSGGAGGEGSGSGTGKGKGRERLVVYTKRDLAEEKYEEPLRKAFLRYAGQKIIFADTHSDKDVRSILRHAISIAKRTKEDVNDLKILVVGMPNVGKSSLLNALRRVGMKKGKAFRTGSLPGITRKLTGTVKINENPSIYVYDTPGVMVTYLGKGEEGAEKGMKLGLTAGMKTDLFEPELLADYLLYRLNLREVSGSSHESYLKSLPFPSSFTSPSNSLEETLDALARRLGTLQPGGIPDLEAAQRYLLRAFIEGKFGKWTLDDLEGDIDVKAEGRSNDAVMDGTDRSEDSELDIRVGRTVQRFLERQQEEEARREEGLPENATQEKKVKKAEAAAKRLLVAQARMSGASKPSAGFVKGQRNQS